MTRSVRNVPRQYPQKKTNCTSKSVSRETVFVHVTNCLFRQKKTNVDITKKLKQQLVTFSNSQRAAISKAAPRSLII